MGEITKRASVYAINNLGLITTRNSFCAIFEPIEAELKKLEERDEIIEKRIDTLRGGLKEILELIKGNTDNIKLLDLSQRLDTLEQKKPPEPARDKDRHDLERGDLVYKGDARDNGQPGIFGHSEGERMYGWWADANNPSKPWGYDWFYKKDITFVLRPEGKDC